MKYTPIALFVFNRPVHTRFTLVALEKNPEFLESPLIIFCDGARHKEEVSQVDEVQRIVRDWPHPNKTIIVRDRNYGLAGSIVSGVTKVCDEYGKVIVLEDDLVTSMYFLKYMNAALVKYQDDERVISIHGYSFPIDNLPEAFFIKGASCWGWATWKRGWDLFESEGKKLHADLVNSKLINRFDIYGAYPYEKMLLDQICGRNDSWAVRWYSSALIHNKLTLHPGRSLVNNIGLDGSGSHCDNYDGLDSCLSSTPIDIESLDVSEDIEALDNWRIFLKSARRKKILKNMLSPSKVVKYFYKRFKI